MTGHARTIFSDLHLLIFCSYCSAAMASVASKNPFAFLNDDDEGDTLGEATVASIAAVVAAKKKEEQAKKEKPAATPSTPATEEPRAKKEEPRQKRAPRSGPPADRSPPEGS
jgi:hypothetical protein